MNQPTAPVPANPPPVFLPAAPADPNIQLPPAPVFPPTQQNVLDAVAYRGQVHTSLAGGPGPVGTCCTEQDYYNAIVYEHSVITQAAAAVAPQAVAPAWFHNAIQQVRMDIRAEVRADIAPLVSDLKRLLNHARGEGRAVPYDIVPLPNGNDPTQPPYNLPPLTSKEAVYNLNAAHLNNYITSYGIGPVPPGANPNETNLRTKAALLRKIRA